MIINLIYQNQRVKWLTAHDDKGAMYWFSGNVAIKQDADKRWRVVVVGGCWLPRKYINAGNAKLGAGMMKGRK